MAFPIHVYIVVAVLLLLLNIYFFPKEKINDGEKQPIRITSFIRFFRIGVIFLVFLAGISLIAILVMLFLREEEAAFVSTVFNILLLGAALFLSWFIRMFVRFSKNL